MDEPRVSVVVPTWNGLRFLPTLLGALAAQTFGKFETVVVENGSSDGSRAWLEARAGGHPRPGPGLKVVALETNHGFAGGVNRGIRAARGELLVLLNNDMEPRPDFLERLVRAADAHPEAGSLASRVLFRHDPSRIDSAGDRLLPSGRSVGIGRGEADGPRFEQEAWVFGGTGGAVLYRRSVLEETGLLDESFFLYVEDTDLAFRAQLRGHRCLYVPGAVTVHVGSASLQGSEDRRARFCLRNHLWLLLKCYPGRLLLKHRRAVAAGIVRECLFAFGATRTRTGALRAALLVLATLADAALRAPLMLFRRFRLPRTVPLDVIEELLA